MEAVISCRGTVQASPLSDIEAGDSFVLTTDPEINNIWLKLRGGVGDAASLRDGSVLRFSLELMVIPVHFRIGDP